MAWLGGLFERIFLFSLLLFVLGFGLRGAALGGDETGGIRFTLLVVPLLALLEEWRRLNRNIVIASKSITAVGVRPTRRAELTCQGCVVYVVAMPVVGVLLGIVSRFWSGAGTQGRVGYWLMSTAVWTIVLVHLWLLFLGGFTWAAVRHRLRMEVPAAARPTLGHPMPWVVAMGVLPFLGLALFQLPSQSTQAAMAQLGLFGVQALARFAEPSVASGGHSGVAATELLLELGPGDRLVEVQPILARYGAHAGRAFPDVSAWEDTDLAQTFVVSVPAANADRLRRDLEADRDNVDSIELNAALDPVTEGTSGACSKSAWPASSLPVNDPYAPGQWALEAIDAPTILRQMKHISPRRPAKIAILDTGVSSSVSDLRGVVDGEGVDHQGHGTEVASVAGAVADNGHGIASLNLDGRWIQILDFPTLADPGAAADDVARDIIEAADKDAAVVNLSFGQRGDPPVVIEHAVAYALARDTIVVAAAGNTGSMTGAAAQWPANVPGVIAVAAVDRTGQRVGNGVRGVDVGIAAAGAAVCVATAKGDYRLTTGSSFASPLVAGVLGILRARCPRTSSGKISAAVVSSARGGAVNVDSAWDALDGCR